MSRPATIPQRLRSIADVKAEFSRRGITAADWARANGIRPNVIYELFSGRSQGLTGQAHKAAVLLGMKEGSIEPEVVEAPHVQRH